MSTPFEMRLNAYNIAVAQSQNHDPDEVIFNRANTIYEFISGTHPSITNPVVNKLELIGTTFSNFMDFYDIVRDQINKIPYQAVDSYFPQRLGNANILTRWIAEHMDETNSNPSCHTLYRQDGNTTTLALLVVYCKYKDIPLTFVCAEQEIEAINECIEKLANFFKIPESFRATMESPDTINNGIVIQIDLPGESCVYPIGAKTKIFKFTQSEKTRFHASYEEYTNGNTPVKKADPVYFDPHHGYVSLIQMTDDIMRQIDALPRENVVPAWTTPQGLRFTKNHALDLLIKRMNGLCADEHHLYASRQKGMTTALVLKAYQCASLGMKVAYIDYIQQASNEAFRLLDGLSMMLNGTNGETWDFNTVQHPSGGSVSFRTAMKFDPSNEYNVVITDNLYHLSGRSNYDVIHQHSRMVPHGLILNGVSLDNNVDGYDLIC